MDQRYLAGDREASTRTLIVVVVIPTGEVLVVRDGETANRRPTDLLGSGSEVAGDRSDRTNTLWVHGRPFEYRHCTHGATDDREPAVDPELIGKEGLRSGDVAVGDLGKCRPIRAPGGRVLRGRPGTPLAAAEDIRADDEELIGIDRLARPDDS